ncbi:WG repeat-containing protein [Spirosoma sp.]|uniref:WG repeat-containing protein n=1 Tax=Spirosoma sp. TaxID=1899569 RepID=UPI002614262C|nr:WG repeat-containing protein [Spirosoma sp.]MCX6215179.1 WG repeat-containing protein [Spirosoma sp.]
MKFLRKLLRSLHLILLTLGLDNSQAQPISSTLFDHFETIRASDNLLIVSKGSKMGVANSSGRLLTQLEYDTIYNFSEGMAIVGRGKREINQFGKILSDFTYGYINKTGRLVIPVQYTYVSDFHDGLGLVESHQTSTSWGNAYTYFNKEGKVALRPNPVYSSSSFQGNLAFVEVPKQGFWLPPYDDGRNNGNHTQLYDVDGETIYGNYIDQSGRLLVPFIYDTIAPFFPGYLRPVRKNGKWGFLDASARLKVPLIYDDIDADSAYFWKSYRRVRQGNQFGFIETKTGNVVVPFEFDDTYPSQTSFVWVKKSGVWGCLNAQRKLAIVFQFQDARPFDQLDRAIVKRNNRWGLIDTTGKLLSAFYYETILGFQDGRAVVRRAGKFGFMDTSGHEIIPANYDEVSQFSNGHAFAKRWGLFLTLDSAGNWVSIKLQPTTLKWLIVSILSLLAVIWLWRKRQHSLRRQTAV